MSSVLILCKDIEESKERQLKFARNHKRHLRRDHARKRISQEKKFLQEKQRRSLKEEKDSAPRETNYKNPCMEISFDKKQMIIKKLREPGDRELEFIRVVRYDDKVISFMLIRDGCMDHYFLSEFEESEKENDDQGYNWDCSHESESENDTEVQRFDKKKHNLALIKNEESRHQTRKQLVAERKQFLMQAFAFHV